MDDCDIGIDVELVHWYRASIRFIFSLIGSFILESKGIPEASEVCKQIRLTGNDPTNWPQTLQLIKQLAEFSGIGLLEPDLDRLPSDKSASNAIQALLSQDINLTLGPIYFEAVPTSWLSVLYQQLISMRPEISDSTHQAELKFDSIDRKRSGSFFTPPHIISYIVSKSLNKKSDLKSAKVLDPSMGAGDFLVQTLRHMAEAGIDRKRIAEHSVYGCDIDPIAVEIARFVIWLESGCKADAKAIAEHLICANSLAGDEFFSWKKIFPEISGFDAVVGNPPYVAIKNRDFGDVKLSKGQADYYLLFLETVTNNDLVSPGGKLAMVLPDPFLVRENAADIRRTLIDGWQIDGIIHVSGAFRGAQVANAILVCTNKKSDSSAFPITRIDRPVLRRQFEKGMSGRKPENVHLVDPSFIMSQPNSEILYLIDNEEWQNVFRLIHGDSKSIENIAEPFVFLGNIVEKLFRGEELGKKAIRGLKGDLPMLLGGQSIRPYCVSWEGCRIESESVRKPMHWYSGQKILLQKSAPKLIAAYDPNGYIVPQSVYGIKLLDNGYSPLYLLAILNSKFMNDYVFKTFTGYKLVQPQLEIEDIKRIPIRSMPFSMDESQRLELTRQAMDVFGNEGLNALVDFARQCLKSGMDDVIHDILANLAERAIRIRKDSRSTNILIKNTDRAIDSIVEILYQ